MHSTVLILDDDSRFRKLVSTVLLSRGYSVIEAATGAQAMRAVEQGRLDIAVVDYHLPDVDGIEWITWVRDRGCNLPMIFLSGFRCDTKMLNKLRNILNVSLVLQKPIEPNTFVDQLESQMELAQERMKHWLQGDLTPF